MKKVCIIILNYNNPKDSILCLESVKKISYSNYVVVLIDNASTDDSCAILSDYINKNYNSKIVFIKSQINKGYAGGNNIGLKYGLEKEKSDFFWILNNDTIVEENSLNFLVKKINANPKIGICGSKLLYEWAPNKLQGYGGMYNKWFGINKTCLKINDIDKIDYVIGASVIVSRSFLNDIGYLNEEYFLYYEELDWAERAKGKYLLDCAVDSIVYHKEGASIGINYTMNERSELSDYFFVRNRIKFTLKYHWICIFSVYIGLIYAIFNRLKRHQYKRMLIIFKLMLGIRNSKYERLLDFLKMN